MGGLCSKTGMVNDLGTWMPQNKNQQDDQVFHERRQEQEKQYQKQQEDQQQHRHEEEEGRRSIRYPDDEFYDGIPRYTGEPQGLSYKSRSVRSTQAAVAKVSEVSARLGKAGSLGIGKAVEVLDTLGSSMTNLNPSSGFVSGGATRGTEISILAFEVANTIVKGSSLMQSLSKRSIRHLKEVVLSSDGVQNLVSKDMDGLLWIVATDKREELKLFSGEVVRFGNRCKDPQWHHLDRYFEKITRERSPQQHLKEEADLLMQQLMTWVQFTAELYHEFHALDRFEQDYLRKSQEEGYTASHRRGDNLAIMRSELKSQRKLVKTLKRKSLWSRSLEEVIGKLVDIVQFLHLEIQNVFGGDGINNLAVSQQRLGPAGLALHYANIVLQIDTLVARSSSMPPNTRDTLYQSLPPSVKLAMRSKLQSFHVKKELTIVDIKAEMEKTLQWLVPISTNTAKAHHGFGWVGEWANTGSESNRKPAIQTDVIRIETLHHADKEKTEAYLLDLLLWLNHLVNQYKSVTNGGTMKSSIKNQKPEIVSTNASSPVLTTEEQEMLQHVNKKKWTRGISKSQDFDLGKTNLKTDSRLSRSFSHSLTRNTEQVPFRRLSSRFPVINFGLDKEKALDVIDRVDMVR